MGDYIKTEKPHREPTRSVQHSEAVDYEKIAQAVADKLSNVINSNMGSGLTNQGTSNHGIVDNFDDSNSMDQLADSMVIERGSKESNFDDLGNVKETKKDQTKTDKTIDILSNLDD